MRLVTTERGADAGNMSSVPCYLEWMNALEARYLRHHPEGAHVAEALATIVDILTHAEETLSRNRSRDFLDPDRECEEVRTLTSSIRASVMSAQNPNANAAADRLDRIAAYCNAP